MFEETKTPHFELKFFELNLYEHIDLLFKFQTAFKLIILKCKCNGPNSFTKHLCYNG